MQRATPFLLFFFFAGYVTCSCFGGDYVRDPTPQQTDDRFRISGTVRNFSQDVNVSPNDPSIQWDFLTANHMELKNSSCNDPTFQRPYDDISQFRFLMTTVAYLRIVDKYGTAAYIGFAVHCPTGNRNDNWFRLFDHSITIDEAKPYVSFVGYIGRCKYQPRRRRDLKEIQVAFTTDQGSTFKSCTSLPFSPLPNDNCSWINNFKTIYLGDLSLSH